MLDCPSRGHLARHLRDATAWLVVSHLVFVFGLIYGLAEADHHLGERVPTHLHRVGANLSVPSHSHGFDTPHAHGHDLPTAGGPPGGTPSLLAAPELVFALLAGSPLAPPAWLALPTAHLIARLLDSFPRMRAQTEPAPLLPPPIR